MGMTATCITYNVFNEFFRWAISVSILISNTLVMITMVKTKSGLGQKGKLYIIALSLADAVNAPAIVLDTVLSRLDFFCASSQDLQVTADRKRLSYAIIGILHTQSLGCSLLTFLAIAIDRLLAIRKPVFYKNHITCFKIKFLLSCIWIYIFGLIVTIYIFFGDKTSNEHVLASFNAVGMLPQWCYVYALYPQIYIALILNILFYTITIVCLSKLRRKWNSNSANQKFKKTKQYVMMTGVALLLMSILWTPYLIVSSTVDAFKPSLSPWLTDYILQLTHSIMFCNSWINPFLYFSLNEDYREAFKKTLHFREKNKVLPHHGVPMNQISSIPPLD